MVDARRPSPRSSPSIAEAFDPRSNSLNALRLLFAVMVVLGHSTHVGFDRIAPQLGSFAAAAVAVDGFFVISGFLIVGSWTATADTRRYLVKRAARIFPGYWVCLIATAFVIFPLIHLSETGGLAGFPFGGDHPAWGYVLTNATLYEYQQRIGDALAGANVPFQPNGSLWTLFYEFGAYLMVVVLGLVGALRAHSRPLIAVTALLFVGLLAHAIDPAGFQRVTHSPYLVSNSVQLGFMFAIGALLQVFKDRIPMNDRGAALAVVVLIASAPLADWRLLGGAPFAYLVLWLGVRLPFPGVGRRFDLSYGVYLYAWPVQQLLWQLGVADAGYVAYTAATLAVVTPLAALSWVAVERPALRRAKRVRSARREVLPPATVAGEA